MNRTDYLIGSDQVYFEVTADTIAHVLRLGRDTRRYARHDYEAALRLQSMPIRLRLAGWRRYGEPKGTSFAEWSPWIRNFRERLHLAAASGSEFAARQLAQALVDDVSEAA